MPTDLRCVECGRTKDLHIGNGLFCPGPMGKVMETHYSTMALPEGRTCKDCYNFRRFCGPIIGYKGTETSCDFFPVRFTSIEGLRKLLDEAEAPKEGAA